MEAKTKDLSEAIQKVGAAMYESQKSEPKTDGEKKPDEKAGKSDKVQEGEVVE